MICTMAISVHDAQSFPSRQCRVMKHQLQLHMGPGDVKEAAGPGECTRGRGPHSSHPQHHARSGQNPKEKTWLFPHFKHKPLTWAQAASHSLQPQALARVRGPPHPGFLKGREQEPGSLHFTSQSWTTLAQRTQRIPIYLQNIKKSVDHLHINPFCHFIHALGLEKIKTFF